MAPTRTENATAKPRKTAARKPRPTAAKRATRTTAPRATASSTQPATRPARAQRLAERAVLIPIGAALEARDRVAGTVGELVTPIRSRGALERQLTRFEHRGGRARTQFEREVRRTRRNLTANVEVVSGRVESVVQNGLNTGIKLVNGAQDRIARAV